MHTVGHPASLMGEELRREVERQLLSDLAHYRSASDYEALVFDWSNPCQEGHRTRVLGGVLESMSDVSVHEYNGRLVAEGWIDFVQGGSDLPPIVFWLFLDLVENNRPIPVKDTAEIPDHVWERLSDETRNACASGSDPSWRADPKVIAWSRRIAG